jgi:hypothetical protein
MPMKMINLLGFRFALLVSCLLTDTTTGRLHENEDIMMGGGSKGPSCGENDKIFSKLSTEAQFNKEQWEKFKPECYTFTLERDSRSTADAPVVPDQVKVVNGQVVSKGLPTMADESETAHTMESLYGIVDKCIDGCAFGSTYQCKVSYGEHGIIEQINVDQQNYIAHEDLSYFSFDQTEFKVSHFAMCDVGVAVPLRRVTPAKVERRLRRA